MITPRRWSGFGLLLAALLIVGALCPTPTADAQLAGNSPVGLWNVTFYNDAQPFMNQVVTHSICFAANGTWTSPTFAGWGGRWFQKGINSNGNGNPVRIFGNYATGTGNDGAEIGFISTVLMAGSWTEWRDPTTSSFRLWARVEAHFQGLCLSPASPMTAQAVAGPATTEPTDPDVVPGSDSRHDPLDPSNWR